MTVHTIWYPLKTGLTVHQNLYYFNSIWHDSAENSTKSLMKTIKVTLLLSYLITVTHSFAYLLAPSLPKEHRLLMTLRQHTLFWAVLAVAVQLEPCCFSSASVSCLQLSQGRPLFLFLFPCWFQFRAWRVMLDAGFRRVCVNQPHFLFRICLDTGSCPTRSHRSSFGILSDHLML